MSVTEYRAPSGKRSVSTSSSPHSYTIVCPSQDRSVDDSPSPAAANTYAARHRADALWHSSDRSDAFVTVIGEPERFASTVAPASAACADGGTGTHMSSQTSTCSVSPSTSAASNSRRDPNGTTASPISISLYGPTSAPRAK